MPRFPAYPDLEVAKAATKLVEQNIHPSIEAIRRELGTGSNSTINHHLKQWRERQGHQLEAQQGLPDTLLVATKGLYEALREEAEQKIKLIEQESQQAKALLQQQLAEQQQTLDVLTQQKKAAQDQIQQLQQQVTHLQSTLEMLQQALAKKITEHELAQTRLEDKTADNQRLSEQLKHAQHNLEHYRESLRQQREEEKQRYEAHISKLEQQAQQSQITLVSAQQTVVTQAQQIKWLEQQRSTLEQTQHQWQRQLTDQALALQKQQNDFKTLQTKHDKVVADYQIADDSLNHLKLNAQQWEVKFEKAQGRIETLEQSLKKAEDNVVLLQNKNFEVIQEKTLLSMQLKCLNLEKSA